MPGTAPASLRTRSGFNTCLPVLGLVFCELLRSTCHLEASRAIAPAKRDDEVGTAWGDDANKGTVRSEPSDTAGSGAAFGAAASQLSPASLPEPEKIAPDVVIGRPWSLLPQLAMIGYAEPGEATGSGAYKLRAVGVRQQYGRYLRKTLKPSEME